MIWMLNSSDQ